MSWSYPTSPGGTGEGAVRETFADTGRPAEPASSAITKAWIWEVAMLSVFVATAFGVAVWQYQRANALPARSQFVGEVGLAAIPPANISEKNKMSARVVIGRAAPAGIAGLTEARNVRISISHSSAFSGAEVYVGFDGDAQVSNVRVGRYGSWWKQVPPVPGSLDGVPRTYRQFVLSGRSIGFRIPPERIAGDNAEIEITGQMKSRVGTISGNLAEVTLPACRATAESFSSCTIDAGPVAAGENVWFTSPSLVDPGLLEWQFPADDFVRRLPGPRIRIADEALSRQRDYRLFTSGAILGFAGGALLELSLRLTQAVTASGRQRRRGDRGGRGRAASIRHAPPAPSSRMPSGELWSEWKRTRS
jgi:hypothetical protein